MLLIAEKGLRLHAQLNLNVEKDVGVYIVMVGIDAIEIASDAILIASQQSTDHILAGQLQLEG